MKKRIHVFGASGSGTTTLGRALSVELGYRHIDTDDYFWLASDPPFQHIREVKERQQLLREELENHENWILSGSLCGWGDLFVPMFELVVFLYIPPDIRLGRIRTREIERYGLDAISKGGSRHEASEIFLNWAAQYDTGGMEVRSRMLHEKWMDGIGCPILRLEDDISVKERMEIVINSI